MTRPKDPELGTAHRARAVRIKSSAELEEEMLSKIPKFKARPLNKKVSCFPQETLFLVISFKLVLRFSFVLKILEAPTFPALPRSIPQPPVFQVGFLELQLAVEELAVMIYSFINLPRSFVSRQWKEQINMLKHH